VVLGSRHSDATRAGRTTTELDDALTSGVARLGVYGALIFAAVIYAGIGLVCLSRSARGRNG
jgi:hypothetical protein